MGLAGAFVSLADDESSLQSNPAGLAKVRGFSVAGSHLVGLLGTQVSQLSLASSLGSGSVLGVQAAYLFDTDTYRDNLGNETGSFSNSNLLAGMALGFSFRPGWRAGLGLKGIQESYAGLQSTSLAGDAGIQGPLWRSLRFGVAAQNIGVQLQSSGGSFAPPLRLQAGLNLPFFIPQWRLSLETQALPLEGAARVLFGTELKVNLDDLSSLKGEAQPLKLALRAGASSALGAFEAGRASLGAGLEFPPTYALDYAFSSVGDLGILHRIALSLRFPGARLPAPAGAELTAPYGLKVTQLLDGIELSWDDANERVVGYNLYADFGVTVEKLNAKPIPRTRQKFTSVEKGRTYRFVVRPVGSDGEEGLAGEALIYRAP